MFVQSHSQSNSATLQRTKAQVSHQQKVQQFAQEVKQKLEAVKGNTATPAQQDAALSKTRQVLKEAAALVKANPDAVKAQAQESALATMAQETQQVKTMVDSAVVVKSQAGSLNQKEAALKDFKQELTRKMIQGLASDMPEVRANARRALSHLGVSESKLDQLRIELEKKKHSGSSSVRFTGHLPVKLHTPKGIQFAGTDNYIVKPIDYDLEQSVLDDVMANNSFDAIANQAVNYQVSNVADHITPILFGAGQTLQLPDGTVYDIPIGAERPALARVIKQW